jgi:hypothetical protein
MILCAVAVLAAVVCYIIKRKRTVLIVVAAAILGILVGIVGNDGEETGVLWRRQNGEGSYSEEYTLDAEGILEGYDYLVEVPQQCLGKEEEEAYIAAAEEEIEKEFPGKNASVNEIRGSVVIRDSYQDGRVEAEWSFDDYSVMDVDGNVVAKHLPEEGTLVKAVVELTCGEVSESYEFYFHVFLQQLTEKEKLLAALEDYFLAQKTDAEKEELVLPEQMENRKLVWKKKKEHIPEKILALGVVLGIGMGISEREKEKRRQKEREQMLKLEYPDMLGKLVLLLGAGMTIGGAWRRIAAAYETKRKNRTVLEMPLYEEMLITCREMEGGVSEERAYQRFGERCKNRQFRKFGNLLAQNLRKGTKGLTTLLESEVEDSLEERKNIARRFGEEAGTKLLVPMMLMLGIVIVILLVPAIMTFQI